MTAAPQYATVTRILFAVGPNPLARGTKSMITRRHLFLAGLVAVVTRASGPARAQTSHTITIRQFAFAPETLEVSVGDTVEWVNEDIVPHTATAVDARWDSGRLDRGQSWSIEIGAPGTIDYSCLFHPAMRARLIAN